MAINFPDSPNDGDIYTVNGKKWIYGGGKWASYGLAIAPDVLKVDSVNNRVGVNNLSPSVDLDVTGNAAVSGSLTVDGDLTISGNTTTLNTTELYVEDNKVTLNSGATGSAAANAGIEVERGDDPNVEILWDESADAWKIATDFTVDAGTLHIDSANNRVGIGTTSPSQTLDVRSANDNTSVFQHTTNGSDARIELRAPDAGGTSRAGQVFFDPDANFVGFRNGNINAMGVDSSGNVGIGTTTPRTPLEIQGASSGSVDEVLLLAADGNAVAGSGARLHLSGGNATQRSAYVEGVNTSGSTNAHALTFGTSAAGNSPVERMRIDASGNVGIGTTTPDSLLHLASTGTAYLRIEADTDNVTESDRPMLEFAHDGGTIGGVIGVNDNQLTLATSVQVGGGIDFRVGTTNYTTEGADVFDNTTSAMYINSSSGNVGIGTITPSAPLEISEAVNNEALRLSAPFNAADQEVYITAVDSQDSGVLAAIGLGTTGGANDNDGAITFKTTSAASTSIPATRMIIDRDGNVGIGTTSPGSLLDIRGGVQTHRILPFSDNLYDLGASILRWDDVYATNGTIQTSDERDKASITDIDLGLAFINDLRPVTYTWDDRSGNVGARTHMGFVAQEVATALGDEASNRAVWIHTSAEQTTDPETGEVDEGRDIQGLRYNELMAPMVKAIQELSATVQTLTARMEALESAL